MSSILPPILLLSIIKDIRLTSFNMPRRSRLREENDIRLPQLGKVLSRLQLSLVAVINFGRLSSGISNNWKRGGAKSRLAQFKSALGISQLKMEAEQLQIYQAISLLMYGDMFASLIPPRSLTICFSPFKCDCAPNKDPIAA